MAKVLIKKQKIMNAIRVILQGFHGNSFGVVDICFLFKIAYFIQLSINVFDDIMIDIYEKN